MLSPLGVISVASISVILVFLLGKNIHNNSDSRKIDNYLMPQNPEMKQPPSRSKLYNFQRAAICSDSYECSTIGRNILQVNGSAVDAALATLICNGLLAMQSMGLGGGIIMNVYIHEEQRSYSILSREVAPLAVNHTAFTNPENNLFYSSDSIAVPTEAMGYAVAHERFGKLPWSQLVEPTLKICWVGYALSKHQRDALETNKLMVSNDFNLRKMFINSSTGEFYKVGTHIQPNPELCRTLELIGKHGPRSFYNGQLAKDLNEDLNDIHSPITQRDFEALSVKVIPSLVVPIDSLYFLHLTPPPGSGYILGYIMNILTNFKKDFQDIKDLGATEVHRIVEALKFGFAKRWELDMKSDGEVLQNLTCPLYARKFAKLINDALTIEDLKHYDANTDLLTRTDHGTAHISVLSPNGDAVAATSSINFYFGSGRSGNRTGIIFNNAMGDFSIKGVRNYFGLPHLKNRNKIMPGGSPMSSMAPTIVTTTQDGVRLVVGAAGGTKILSALAQVLVRTLWLGENIKQAIDAARFHHQLLPNTIDYEYGILQSVIDDLEAKQHKTKRYRERGSAVCGIEVLNKSIFANADYRKEGGVAGL